MKKNRSLDEVVMSHSLKAFKDGVDVNTDWFKNSWLAMRENQILQEDYHNNPHRSYELLYNVKIRRGGRYNTTEYVDFPSEEEAMLFVLTWS